MTSDGREHIEFGAVCPKCSHTQLPLALVAGSYFEGKEMLCRNEQCRKPIDYWSATLGFIGGEGIPTILLVSIGARETFFDITLSAGMTKEIDLTQHGIPDDATLLGITFTPQGADCFPQVMHSNQVPFRSLKSKFHVYGLPISDGEGGNIEVDVAWVQKGDNTISWSYLLDAFEAMASHHWRSAILPAYAAFEIALSPLVLEGLAKHISKTVVDSFKGEKSFSSSSALNVLLPILCKEANLPPLPEGIRIRLNQLRRLRNDMVHEGVENTAVSQELAGESLCASVFGLEYLRYIRPRLLPEESSEDRNPRRPRVVQSS
jgi:hypothetical protein